MQSVAFAVERDEHQKDLPRCKGASLGEGIVTTADRRSQRRKPALRHLVCSPRRLRSRLLASKDHVVRTVVLGVDGVAVTRLWPRTSILRGAAGWTGTT